MDKTIGLRATLLTPLAFHGLMADGGSSTIADLLSDKAMAFAVAESLGWMPAGVALPARPAYREHLASMPYRLSMFMPAPGHPAPRLGFPQARKLNIDAEGGRLSSLASVTSSGNIKDYFTIQEVQPGAVYEGLALCNSALAQQLPQSWVVRSGLGRQAMIQVDRIDEPTQVVLNAHTAALFGRGLPCYRYYLHTLQSAPPVSAHDAASEMKTWV